MGAANANEVRPGLPLPRREREALARVVGAAMVANAGPEGEPPTGEVVFAEYREGWPEAHLWHGLRVDSVAEGCRRVVHAWSGRTRINDADEVTKPFANRAEYQLYDDGDARVVEAPIGRGETGPTPRDLIEAYTSLREFAEIEREAEEERAAGNGRAFSVPPQSGAYSAAAILPDLVLRTEAERMLAEADMAARSVPA